MAEVDPWAPYRAQLSALCAQRELCEWEVVRKLEALGVPAEGVVSVVGYLREHRFIDDARYAWHFARRYARFHRWGPLKIAASLRSKQIPEPFIATALARLREEGEGVEVFTLLKRKLESLPQGLSTYKQRERLLRYAMGKGIEAESARRAVGQLLPGGEDYYNASD